jgi:hypothetical protein
MPPFVSIKVSGKGKMAFVFCLERREFRFVRDQTDPIRLGFHITYPMSYLDMYRNFDARFAEDNASMVSFPTSHDVRPIVFAGLPGSGKLTLLSQLNDKFRLPPGSSHIEPDIQRSEIRNVIFRIPIVDIPAPLWSSRPIQLLENCGIIIVIIDVNSDLPLELLQTVNDVRRTLDPVPQIRVFLNKIDMVDPSRSAELLGALDSQISRLIEDAPILHTSINDGSSLLQVSLCISELLPKSGELKQAMADFTRSLDLSHSFLVDLQSRACLMSAGSEPLDADTFLVCQDGIEMFVGLATMMDARTAQSAASVELTDGSFFHFFWSTYDVILAGVAEHRAPSATAKNNVIALLSSIKKVLHYLSSVIIQSGSRNWHY